MNPDLIESLGKGTGIGGLILILMVSFYKYLVAKKIITPLNPKQSHDIVNKMVLIVGGISLVGIILWFYSGTIKSSQPNNEITKTDSATINSADVNNRGHIGNIVNGNSTTINQK